MTHLVVTEGAVVVRHGGVGEARRRGRAVAERLHPARRDLGARLRAPRPRTTGSVASTLGEQNDLFAEAIVAKRSGESQIALATFDRFLATYPSSPLAQSAAVERMRLLRAAQSPRAIAAARQYLARYPNGFARAEAEAILAGAR